MNTLLTKHLYIAGRVQGVYYRQSMREMAERLQIAGWCRNLPDGRVEAIIQGEEGAINAMIEWTHQGPPQAMVESVQVLSLGTAEETAEDTSEKMNGFEVRR